MKKGIALALIATNAMAFRPVPIDDPISGMGKLVFMNALTKACVRDSKAQVIAQQLAVSDATVNAYCKCTSEMAAPFISMRMADDRHYAMQVGKWAGEVCRNNR